MELASHDSKAIFQFFCAGFKKRYDTLTKFNTFPKTGESLVWYCHFFKTISVLKKLTQLLQRKHACIVFLCKYEIQTIF
jgi:hypothetical protein